MPEKHGCGPKAKSKAMKDQKKYLKCKAKNPMDIITNPNPNAPHKKQYLQKQLKSKIKKQENKRKKA